LKPFGLGIWEFRPLSGETPDLGNAPVNRLLKAKIQRSLLLLCALCVFRALCVTLFQPSSFGSSRAMALINSFAICW
jgi:hypothetical protein